MIRAVFVIGSSGRTPLSLVEKSGSWKTVSIGWMLILLSVCGEWINTGWILMESIKVDSSRLLCTYDLAPRFFYIFLCFLNYVFFLNQVFFLLFSLCICGVLFCREWENVGGTRFVRAKDGHLPGSIVLWLLMFLISDMLTNIYCERMRSLFYLQFDVDGKSSWIFRVIGNLIAITNFKNLSTTSWDWERYRNNFIFSGEKIVNAWTNQNRFPFLLGSCCWLH